MNANELRIGNYVNWYTEGKNYQVKIERSDFTRLMVIENMEPIPLTDEWLEKFGFKNNFIELETPDMTLNIVSKVNGIWLYLDDCMSNNTFPLRVINYVHELQNLYFTLTGKELKKSR